MIERQIFQFTVPIKWIPSNIDLNGSVIIEGEQKGKIILSGDLVNYYRYVYNSNSKWIIRNAIEEYLTSCGICSYFPY